jgi:hypothetical protein
VPYSIVNVDDIEPSGPGGAVRFVRRELGVEEEPVRAADPQLQIDAPGRA